MLHVALASTALYSQAGTTFQQTIKTTVPLSAIVTAINVFVALGPIDGVTEISMSPSTFFLLQTNGYDSKYKKQQSHNCK